jgi:DHA2 family multidrug resistance protein
MTNIDLQMDFRTAVLYRIYQTSGLAFLFVPISTLAYAGMPPEKNNQLSAMINLFRNIGGSVGISVASTLIARRAQVHQDTLVTHATDYDQAFRHMFSAFRNSFASAGASKADAAHRAYGQIYGVVQQQANAQAYVDTIFLLAIGCALMIPLVLLMQKVKPGEIQLGH